MSQLGNLPPELARAMPKRAGAGQQAAATDIYNNSQDYSLPYRFPLSDYRPENLAERLERTDLDGSEIDQNQPKAASNWSRSYQNPVGTVYYPPSEPDDRWAWPPTGAGPGSSQQPRDNSATPPYHYPMFLPAGPMFHDPSRGPQQSLNYGAYKNSPKAPLAFYLPMPYAR